MSWSREPERGSQWLLRFMVLLTLRLGWRIGNALLYPITLYFLLFGRRARMASRDFLARAIGRPVGPGAIFHHYFTFASTILDRVFLLTGRTGAYTIEVSGLEHVEQHLAAGQGAILLGSHIGSFEVLRTLADQDCPVPVKVLMYEANAVRANAVFHALNPSRAASVIQIGTTGALLRVKEALAAGELVGLLGDRCVAGEKLVPVDFLGRAACLPIGPFVLAGVLAAPIVLVFGIHRGPRHYAIRFEPFAERIELARERRANELAGWVQRYAQALETVVRAHPYNWFNFYDFWASETTAPPSLAAAHGRRPRHPLLGHHRSTRRGGRDRYRHADGDPLQGGGEPRQLR